MTDNYVVQGRASIPPPSPKVAPLRTPAVVPGMDLPTPSYKGDIEHLDLARQAIELSKATQFQKEMDPMIAASAPSYGGFNTWVPIPELDALDEGEIDNEDQYAADADDLNNMDDFDGIEMEGMNNGRVSIFQTGGPVFGKTKAVDQQPKNMFVRSEDPLVGGSMSLNTRNAALMAKKGGFCGSPLLSNVIGSMQGSRK